MRLITPLSLLSSSFWLSQPHQPFFLLGIIHSLIGMLLFMLSYKGVVELTIDPAFFHAYWMIFVVFTHFFHGFLLTTFPRFCITQPVAPSIYTRFFTLYSAGAFLFVYGALVSKMAAMIASVAILAAHIDVVRHLITIYRAAKASHKTDVYWMLKAHGIGIASHLIFVALLFNLDIAWQRWAIQCGTWGYLLFLAFVVAQRMIPFFSHITAHKPRFFIATIFSLLLIKIAANGLSFGWIEVATTLVLALYLGKVLINWQLPFFSSPAILWVLHLALFWLPTSLLLDALIKATGLLLGTDFLFAGLHLGLIGFLTTILIGFGTRVTLGHSGQVPHADRLSVTLFWLTQLVVLVRFGYSIAMGYGLDLSWLFDLSATLWIILFGSWGIKFGPTLLFGNPNR